MTSGRTGGSSPRARGTPTEPGAQAAAIRFIPASAGNTALDAVDALHHRVHPRERGEHSK